jgi:diguanylate cyclase (GGDEF)-like protein/PAS domain S-box-containing protein
MSDVRELAPTAFVQGTSAVCDAVLRLRGDALVLELSRLVRILTGSAQGRFVPGPGLVDPGVPGGRVLRHAVAVGLEQFGWYEVSGFNDHAEASAHALAALAQLTASLMQMHSLAQRSTHAYAQMEAQLAHQSQILDQIHESVLTMDQMGYITSWNRGAERLFGYTSFEAVGRNILFLYADEDLGDEEGGALPDLFAEHGGRMMEVKRRKKSGDIFWASLSLSPLRDLAGRPNGLIAYLTDITERKQAEEQLHHLAYYDELTGLPNRTLFARLVDQALMVAQRNETAGCILFIDLNRFKRVNDTLGRRIGDELLKQVGQRFKATLRDEDLVARLSGDEYAVGLADVRQHFEATTVAQKLQAALDAPFMIAGHDLRVGASIGISVYPQDGNDAETLLALADIAMERAKGDDANPDRSVAFYSQDMNKGMQERMRIESGLRHALGNGELVLYYQPKFEIASGRLVGAEALVRWMHPERGIVPPGEFIPLAETTGLIVQVGEWVLEEACAQASIWQRSGIAPFRVAVNVSAREFTPSLPERVATTLRRYQLDPSWLELEITESTLMHDVDRVTAIMDQITALGVSLSLDDFGTGFSSLSYLKRFPIHTLKIDRSFTMGIPADGSDCAIAGTIISMARQLCLRVIAEGVETLDQLAFLRGAGCDEVQGYLYAAPLPAYAFEKALRENWALVG